MIIIYTNLIKSYTIFIVAIFKKIKLHLDLYYNNYKFLNVNALNNSLIPSI